LATVRRRGKSNAAPGVRNREGSAWNGNSVCVIAGQCSPSDVIQASKAGLPGPVAGSAAKAELTEKVARREAVD
jgi:hypothetical protein